MRRRILSGLVAGVSAVGAVILSGGAVLAADMPVKAAAYKAPAAFRYDWTGFYAGLNAGYGAALDPVTHEFTPATDGGYQIAIAPSGALGGGQIGYNWQSGLWVLGVEADAQFGNLKQSLCYDFCGALTFGISQKQSWLATARGRVGMAFGPVLLYGTGGAAFTSVKTTLSQTNGATVTEDFSDNRAGWTAGGGIEAAISGPWTAKLEYLYMDFGTVSHSIPGAFRGAAFPNNYSIDLREHVVKAGLNYRFGAAPYALASAGDASATPGPAVDWTGFYVGGNLGAAVQRSPYDMIRSAGVFNQSVFVPTSAAGGVQVGAMWQANSIAAGIEADVQLTNLDQSQCFDFCLSTEARTISEKSSWFATVRGRVGVVAGPTLYYATGGAVFTSIKTDYLGWDGPVYVRGSFTDNKTGWALGGGIETMLWGNWSAKAEYLYLDFGTVEHTMPYLVGAAGNETFSIDVRDHVFRLGLNYRFGGH